MATKAEAQLRRALQIVYNPIRDNKLLTLLKMGREWLEFIFRPSNQHHLPCNRAPRSKPAASQAESERTILDRYGAVHLMSANVVILAPRDESVRMTCTECDQNTEIPPRPIECQ
jgi:hypothetical protein